MKPLIVPLLLILYTVVFSYFSLTNYYTPAVYEMTDIVPEAILTLMAFLLLVFMQRFVGTASIRSLFRVGFSLLFLSNLSDLLDEFCSYPEHISIVIDDTARIASYIALFTAIVKWIEENRALVNSLKFAAEIDQLTSLKNRQTIDNLLSNSIKQSKRYDFPLSIVLIDIDHFKEINDTFGHPAGDAVLADLGTILLNEIRETDDAGRYGGEEFLLVLPHTDAEQAGVIAERIRHHVESFHFAHEKPVTASFGIAIYQSGDSLKEIVHRADLALYNSKHNGRNQISVA